VRNQTIKLEEQQSPVSLTSKDFVAVHLDAVNEFVAGVVHTELIHEEKKYSKTLVSPSL
jgi:hypothetical protein